MCYLLKTRVFTALLTLLLFVSNAFAAPDPTNFSVMRGQADSINVNDSCFTADLNYFTLDSLIDSTINIQNVVSVGIDASSPFYIQSDFLVTISLAITVSRPDSADTTYNRDFVIDYKKAEGSKNKVFSYFSFMNGYAVKVKITGITPTLPPGVSWDYKRVLVIKNELTATRDYKFSCTAAPPAPQITIPVTTETNPVADELKVSWTPPNNGQTEYDLEWAWVDEAVINDYITDGNFDQQKIFTDNATRVSVFKNEYYIPLLYDGEGRVFVRVRPVQIRQVTRQRIEGAWSHTQSGSGNTSGGDMFVFTGHQDNLNWQASTSFAEEGKRKSVVQYFDGTLRVRQTVTKDNSSETSTTRPTTVVAESFYDYQGRAVIQVLPAPTLNTVIAYSHYFNQAVGYDGYPKWAYDKLSPEGGSVCGDPATAMQTTSGAGKYYSPNNSSPNAITGADKFIPNSSPDGVNAYPFTETRFKPDATGRVASQGGVGIKHQIGSSHETKYTDEVPSQAELDALFGTDVGNFTHYTKNWVKDANGQYSVSYVDMKGRTIATALAGQSPQNLESLDSRYEKTIEKNLIDPNSNFVSTDGRSVVSTGSIVLAQPSQVTIKYSVSPEQLKMLNCNNQQICYDCLYDLVITVTAECNNIAVSGSPFVRSNFTLEDLLLENECRENPGFDITYEIPILQEGSYNITKELRVSSLAQNHYRDNVFMPNNTCKTKQDFITATYNQLLSQADCNVTCASCTTSLGANFQQFVSKLMDNQQVTDTTGMTVQLQMAYEEAKAGCDRICNEGKDDGMGNIRNLRQIMLMDMTAPGGQYARIDDASVSVPFNIFSSETISGQNPYSPLPYSVPVFLHPQNMDASGNLIANDMYTDEEGNEQLNMIANANMSPTDFSLAFEQNWANALLPYHPEYSKLILCETQLKTTHNFEGRLNDINTWSEAASQNLIDGIFSQDPFFAGNTPISTQPLKDIMEQKIGSMIEIPDCNRSLSMLEVALATVNCRNKPDVGNCSDVNGLLYCISHQTSSSINNNCADKDYAWKAFKTFYLSERKKLIDQWLEDHTEIDDALILSYYVEGNPRYTLRFPGISRAAETTGFGQLLDQVNASISGGPTGGENIVNDQLQQQYEAACNGYATYWFNRLMTCPQITEITTDDRDWLLPKLVEICKTGSDVDHPVGSSSLPPLAPGEYQDFPAVIKKYLEIKNIPISAFCHPYLIEAPKPYDKQVSPVTMPVVSKPSDCQCDKINDLKTQFNQSGFSGTFSQYLEYRHGTYIAQGALDTLLALCHGTFPCNFIDPPIQLPVVLQCSGSNEVMPKTCINCDELQGIISEYVQKFGIEGVPMLKPVTDEDYAKNISFELFANNATGFRKTWMEWLSFKNLCAGTGKYACQTLDSVLQLFYQSPAYLANPSGTQCRQNFANFFNNALGVFYSFDQILNIFSESCKYIPDVCNPRITCTKLNTIANEFYSLYGTSVSTNTNCVLLFTNYFNSKVQKNYNYDQIREIYKLVCGCKIDFCKFPNDILLNNAYDAFKDYYANSTLPLVSDCQDLFVAFFANYYQVDPSFYTWEYLANKYSKAKNQGCGKHYLEELCEVSMSCNTFQAIIDMFYTHYNSLSINISAQEHCKDSFALFFNNHMSTNFSYVQIAQLYADNKVCGQPLVICTPSYECEDLLWLLNYFNTVVPHTPANCKDEFIELFNMYYGTSYTDLADINSIYENFCTTVPNICGSTVELTSCEQSWGFLQEFFEDHPDPKGEFGNECESVFMLSFNNKFGTNYTNFQDLVDYYSLCGVTLNVCTPLCETLYEYIFASMPGITCTGLQLPLSAGQQLFVSLFNQQIKMLAAKPDGELLQGLSLQLINQLRNMAEHEFSLSEVMSIVNDCSPAYTGCLSLINPNLENQNLNVNDPDVLISIKQAYYLMHSGGLPENCQTDFTSWFNLVMGTVYSYEDLQDLYQTVAGPGAQYICQMPAGEPEIVLGGNTDIEITSAPLLCGLNEPLFPEVPIKTDPCADLLNIATGFGEDAFELYKDSLRNVFDTAYLNKCLSVRSGEKLTVTYTVSEYHYTLYYYDQAGNLVKTIPPAGVHPFDENNWQELVATARENGTVKTPPHTLPTNYRYNTLNQVIAQHTPDAGLSEFWYDRLGRLVVSRNAKQKVHNRYSYTKYDDLGRITEVGQKPKLATAAEMSQLISQNASDEPGSLKYWLNTTDAAEMKEQITATVYDEGYEPFCSNTNSLFCQKNLRNRVSYTYVKPTEVYNDAQNQPIPWDAATLYSYDIHGNVDVLLQDFRKGLGEVLCEGTNNPSGNRWKKIEYAYDLISGKVNEVAYQRGELDAFYHRYKYDAENRITEVFTSKDAVYWERDAAYNYYKHGPLARTLLGHDFVQGIDYAYTLHGWLKGVNSTSVGDGSFDIGKDGTGTTNALVAKDVYGFSLNYFNGDYTPISSTVANTFVSVPNVLAQTTYNENSTPDLVNTGRDLFNGNIRAMVVNIPKVGNANLYAYRYDQLNRLLAMNTYSGFDNTTNSFTSAPVATNDYKERISYDANGNIMTYLRNGAAGVNGIAMDKLFYQYPMYTNSSYIRDNKLRNVLDLGGGSYTEDLKSNAPAHITDENQLFGETLEVNQPTDNYKYDEIGNLVYDNKEGITNIEWNVYGKIASIEKAAGTIYYSYDAAGNRISKTLNGKTTYYVRDASGNVMSVYEKGNSNLNGGDLTQAEIHLYGSSRLGIYTAGTNMECFIPSDEVSTFTRGNKFFELSNHLGNVLVTITDNRRQHSPNDADIDYYEAEIATANDYYPFGMIMPGRKFTAPNSSYRYGFNGKENDNEVKGEGNQQDYGMRIYDPRLGKFLSVDPLSKKFPYYTPYQFAGNSPCVYIDLDGAEPTNPPTPGTPSGQNQQPSQLSTGNLAHDLFTQYIRRMDPGEQYWQANRTIAVGMPLRADLTYSTPFAGGVWEIKPAPPSPSAGSAGSQAALYATALNLFNNTNKYQVGTNAGTPPPFVGILPLNDPVSKRSFEYTLNDKTGAIWYTETTKQQRKQLSPQTQTVTSPQSKTQLAPQLPPIQAHPDIPGGLMTPPIDRLPAPIPEAEKDRQPGLIKQVWNTTLLKACIQAAINCIQIEQWSNPSGYDEMY